MAEKTFPYIVPCAFLLFWYCPCAVLLLNVDLEVLQQNPELEHIRFAGSIPLTSPTTPLQACWPLSLKMEEVRQLLALSCWFGLLCSSSPRPPPLSVIPQEPTLVSMLANASIQRAPSSASVSRVTLAHVVKSM